MGAWLPTKQAVVAETIAALIVGGIVWLLLRGFDFAGQLRPSATDVILVALAGLLAAGIVQVLVLRRRFDPARAREAQVAIQERDDLEKQVGVMEERLTIQAHLKKEREDVIEDLTPKVGWADSLIERERGSVHLYLQVKCELWKVDHLDDAEPYFDIWIPVVYTGVMQLVIGETISGHLEWEGNAFSREPIASGSGNAKPPIVANGPTSSGLRLRQYVTTEARAKEIKEYLARGVIEMEFWSRNFEVSLSKKSFDGEVVAEGQLIGDYLPASTRD